MQSISPVFTEQEKALEIEVAKNQPEYLTVIGLPVSLQLIDRETGASSILNPWAMAFRFRLSEEERAAVALGKDLILTQLNFGKPVTPMNVQFCAEGEKPVFGEGPAVPESNLVMMPGPATDAQLKEPIPNIAPEVAIADATGWPE